MKSKLYFVLTIILLVFVFNSCAEKTSEKKIEKSVERKTMVSKPISVLNKGFHKAFFSPNSDMIIASSENDKGLTVYDFNNDVMEYLNGKDGAGINPVFTQDGKYVVFQSHSFVNRRRMTSLFFQDVKEKIIKPILINKRDIKLLSVNHRDVIFLDGDDLKSFNILTGEEIINPKGVNLAYTDNNLNLIVYINGEKNKINPLGEGNYIWVSMSPDGKSVVYNKTGKGTYVCDLNGKTITDLGRLHASKWSNDSKWIIGMDDYDDGYKYTKSDILMVSVDGKTKKNLTENSDVIALNPDISKDDSKVIYHNVEGRVYLMNLK